jgi:hypothetical protein
MGLAFWNLGVFWGYLFNLLICSHFNFLHLMRCQVGIWCCKRGLLQHIQTQGVLYIFFIIIIIIIFIHI